jgi:rhamnopyranosyl-N-acetylglucosaminyl-diphospho-decaprenol beta-1,3/1,4-galactofuranosyltransferase
MTDPETTPPLTAERRNPERVCAIVVTYNRLELLKASLAALRAQTRPLDAIVVVDNGCTDGTGRWLATESEQDAAGILQVVTQANLGNSGGVFTGMKTAFAAGHDWFWVLDDDTIPSPSALEMLLAGAGRFRTAHPGTQLGWLNSVVLWSDGSLHRMNEPKLKPYLDWGPRFLADRCLPAQWCSFVSVLFTREAVAACGLPLKDMFIWYDDVEYTARIELRGFAGAVVPDSVVEHRTKLNYTPDVKDINAENCGRFRYAFRNEVLVLRTILAGRPLSLAIRFARLMLRRTALLARARKFRHILPSLIQGFKGLTMERRIEFPCGDSDSPDQPHGTMPTEPTTIAAHVRQA